MSKKRCYLRQERRRSTLVIDFAGHFLPLVAVGHRDLFVEERGLAKGDPWSRADRIRTVRGKARGCRATCGVRAAGTAGTGPLKAIRRQRRGAASASVPGALRRLQQRFQGALDWRPGLPRGDRITDENRMSS